MKKLIYNGFTYEVFIRPWLKGDEKYEVIKYKTGYRNFWERISYIEYLSIIELKNNKTK